MTIDLSAEILRLRATVRDLLALSTIPETWVGREPPAIAADLADLLIGSLKLDYAFVRLRDPTGCQVVEVTRGNSWRAFPEWLQQHLAGFGQISRKEIVTNVGGVQESCCGIVIPIGVNSERGLVAAASGRPDFPNQIDQQLLSVAANNAATAFQNAFLINELRKTQEALRDHEQELRKARDELEIKVAERTSELQRSTQELQRGEFYLAEGQRLGHTGSWALNPSGFFEYWSQELFQIYGLDPQKGAPTLEQYLATVHPQDRDFMAETVKRICEQGSGCDVKKRIIRPDGAVRYVRCVSVPVLDNGVLKMFLGTAMDVTEQEQLTQELQRREAYLAEAQRLSHTGSFGWRPDTGEIVWSDETYRIFEYDRSVKSTIESVVQRVHPQDRTEFQKVVDGGSRGATDFEHIYRLLLPNGRVKHVHAIAHALQDASGNREFVGAVSDITERNTAEEALRSSEAYLAEAQRLSHTGSWAWSPDTDIRHWSEECYRILGFDPREGSPRMEEFIQRIHPDDQLAFRESANKARHNRLDEEVDYRIVHSDGAVRDIHSIGHPVFSPRGELIEYTGSVIDVTERKRAEEDLRASERKYRHLVDTTPAFIHTALPDGSLDFLSRGWLEYGGLPQTGLLDWRWTAAIHSEDVEGFVDKWRAALASGEPFEAESRVKRADGEYRWFLQRNVPLRDETGKIVKWYGTGIDIEERKTAEETVREQETELRQMLDLAPQQIAVFGPAGERLYTNRSALDYIGLSLEEWRKTPGTFFSSPYFHPDDRERAAHTYSHSAGSSGSAFELELRVRRADGNYRWFLVRFNPLHDDKGQLKRWYVALTDIDEHKRAEQKLQQENVALREEIDKASMFEEIVGTSPALQTVLSRISKVAPSDSTVLITGETGSGKELVARAIHRRSKRASRAFVSVNCAVIPRDLIASELFGHEKGAFTGATQQRLGRFELANGGTLFLDEVGELPAETQIALLRVLQEHEFERVGGTRPLRADVRVIAATNRDLQAAISVGSFRSDLFYRLHVFPIDMPSLRERREDIPLLVEYFIDRYARKVGKNVRRVAKKTLELLQLYPWPGNIRELQNVIERSVILCETETFSIDESWLPQQPQAFQTGKPKNAIELPRRLEEQERDMIEAALKESRGRIFGPKGAAAKLGIPRSTLESKIQSLKIDKNRFRT